MKRLWVGILLLLVLLAGTLAVTVAMDLHLCAHGGSPGSGGSGGGGGAVRALAGPDGGLCGHGPMEEMDALFARAEICGDAQERKALCAELAQRARAMSNAHSPTWWNLL